MICSWMSECLDESAVKFCRMSLVDSVLPAPLSPLPRVGRTRRGPCAAPVSEVRPGRSGRGRWPAGPGVPDDDALVPVGAQQRRVRRVADGKDVRRQVADVSARVAAHHLQRVQVGDLLVRVDRDQDGSRVRLRPAPRSSGRRPGEARVSTGAAANAAGQRRRGKGAYVDLVLQVARPQVVQQRRLVQLRQHDHVVNALGRGPVHALQVLHLDVQDLAGVVLHLVLLTRHHDGLDLPAGRALGLWIGDPDPRTLGDGADAHAICALGRSPRQPAAVWEARDRLTPAPHRMEIHGAGTARAGEARHAPPLPPAAHRARGQGRPP